MKHSQTPRLFVGTAALGCPVERSSTATSPCKQLPASARPNSRGRLSLHVFLAAFILLLATFASAQTLTGTVKNATTGKPAAGDEVILLSLGQGMEEAGRTKADAKGNFSFKLDKPRARTSSASFTRKSPITAWRLREQPRSRSKSTMSARRSKVIEVVADIMRFQAGQGQLQVERTFAVQNNSKPPRTQMNEHNLEFYVPEGATISEGQAMTAGGQPVNSAPVPEGENAKNSYSFLFPLRPGETRFNVVYTRALHWKHQRRSQECLCAGAFRRDRARRR